MSKKMFFLYALLLSFLGTKAQIKFNGNFEELDEKGMPRGWVLAYHAESTYIVQLDSFIKRQGKYSISITSVEGKDEYGAINLPINKSFHGKNLLLVGTIKTENVSAGFAGLWLRVDGTDGKILALENMQSNGITGTNDWKEYWIQIPYNENEAVNINMGAWLSGKGKIWIDSLRLYLDEKPIQQSLVMPTPFFAGEGDTSFSKTSGIDTILLTKQNLQYLNLLGQLWGFLKYHHTRVAKGNYNWDVEIFRIAPLLIKCKTTTEASKVLEDWIDKIGKPPACIQCVPVAKIKSLAIKPDYGILFSSDCFSNSLKNKLSYILANHNTGYNYYVSYDTDKGGKAIFKHEKPYADMVYPDAGYRLLALYRYLNMIQYFFPSRNLVTEGWNNILPQYIPQLIRAENKIEYAKTIQKLIASIHDTHAAIGFSKALDEYKGDYRLPFQAKFVEGSLVVTGYYADVHNVKEKFKIGDVIIHINGASVKNLVTKYLSLTPASNYGAKLRDLPGNYLLRSNNPQFNLEVLRSGKYLQQSISGIKKSSANFFKYDWNRDSNAPGYYLLAPQIGYIFAGRYKNNELDEIRQKFASTKAIVVDMRCYPSDELYNTFGNYIKSFSSPFIKFSECVANYPGVFVYTQPATNGGRSNNNYKGKVVVIVNEFTQSNAEFVTMAFQSDSSVTVIGSTTSGADGNISNIVLPGDITTCISGLGVYYPDGTNAQRKGVKINYVIKPTIRGIKEGRDEVLEKAAEIINASK